MTKEERSFFEAAPAARRLYYERAVADWKRADLFFHFLKEIRARGFLARIEIRVENQTAGIDLALTRKPGEQLFEFLANWSAGMAFQDAAIIEEMRQIWPDLPEVVLESVGKIGR